MAKITLRNTFLRHTDVFFLKYYHHYRVKYGQLRKKILSMPAAKDPAYRDEVRFCRWFAPAYFCNYKLNRHVIKKTPVLWDDALHLWYVFDEGKRLYFPATKTQYDVYWLYRSLCMEQDARSPHRYCDDTFAVALDSVVFDIGAAEGIFGLRNIDRIKRLYLFECAPEWLEALNATFQPWKEKVQIVQRFVTDTVSDTETTIDTFWNEIGRPQIDFIKMDIEGFEPKALMGAKQVLDTTPHLKLAVCSYHTATDEKALRDIFAAHHYSVTAAPGHVLYLNDAQPWQEWEEPYFRTAVLRAYANPAIISHNS